jgi:hypothetical protein
MRAVNTKLIAVPAVVHASFFGHFNKADVAHLRSPKLMAKMIALADAFLMHFAG